MDPFNEIICLDVFLDADCFSDLDGAAVRRAGRWETNGDTKPGAV